MTVLVSEKMSVPFFPTKFLFEFNPKSNLTSDLHNKRRFSSKPTLLKASNFITFVFKM